MKIKPVCPRCRQVVGNPDLAYKQQLCGNLYNYWHISCAKGKGLIKPGRGTKPIIV